MKTKELLALPKDENGCVTIGKYKVKMENGLFWVNSKSYFPNEFVFGQIHYIDATNDFPDDVHAYLWIQFDLYRGVPVYS